MRQDATALKVINIWFEKPRGNYLYPPIRFEAEDSVWFVGRAMAIPMTAVRMSLYSDDFPTIGWSREQAIYTTTNWEGFFWWNLTVPGGIKTTVKATATLSPAGVPTYSDALYIGFGMDPKMPGGGPIDEITKKTLTWILVGGGLIAAAILFWPSGKEKGK